MADISNHQPTGASHGLQGIQIPIPRAVELCENAFKRAGYSHEQAAIIADHLIDAELRGHPFAGMARASSIVEHLKVSSMKTDVQIEVTRSGASHAHLDGHDAVGYLVARQATEIAIEKAKSTGVSVVGANGLWYTGNLSYYAEMATREYLIVLIASNGSRIVAPWGSPEPKFCTNPFCIGFPTSRQDQPVIWDIGTSNIMFAQVKLAERLGAALPEGSAYDSSGNPTTNPLDVIHGAMTAWGGAKGSGLAMMVQLLGIAAGSSEPTPFMSDFGFLVLAFDPSVLGSLDRIRSEADKFCDSIRSAKRLKETEPVRMPFDRSVESRKAATERGWFHVNEEVVVQLEDFAKTT